MVSRTQQVSLFLAYILPLLTTVSIAQEAMTNAARHGQAKNCTVELEANSALCLTISDDGLGLPPNASSGVGLISMRERVAELGGTFTIQSLPAGGTQINVNLPFD